MDIAHEVHEALGIHRHQVHYLPHCACATSLVAQLHSLGGEREKEQKVMEEEEKEEEEEEEEEHRDG